MAVTNIMRLKRLSSSSVASPIHPEEIQVGFEAFGPAPTGGYFKYHCVFRSETEAKLMPTNPEWQSDIWAMTVAFDAPEMTAEEIREVDTIFNRCLGASSSVPTQEERRKLNRAQSLGFVNVLSTTQANWTELGLRKLKAALA